MFFTSWVAYAHMSQSKVQVIQDMRLRKSASTQAMATRYVRERPYGKIDRQRKLQLDTIYISVGVKNLMVLVWIIDLGFSSLRGETVSHTMHAPGLTEKWISSANCS